MLRMNAWRVCSTVWAVVLWSAVYVVKLLWVLSLFVCRVGVVLWLLSLIFLFLNGLD